MGRGLIFWREPLRRPLSLFKPELKQPYAALAILSDCYSPPKGRLSTCYAPVRRCTRGLPLFLARLACVKPAANVRSEPGSNSPIKVSFLVVSLNCSSKTFRGFTTWFLPFPFYSVFRDQLCFRFRTVIRSGSGSLFKPPTKSTSFFRRLLFFHLPATPKCPSATGEAVYADDFWSQWNIFQIVLFSAFSSRNSQRQTSKGGSPLVTIASQTDFLGLRTAASAPKIVSSSDPLPLFGGAGGHNPIAIAPCSRSAHSVVWALQQCLPTRQG